MHSISHLLVLCQGCVSSRTLNSTSLHAKASSNSPRHQQHADAALTGGLALKLLVVMLAACSTCIKAFPPPEHVCKMLFVLEGCYLPIAPLPKPLHGCSCWYGTLASRYGRPSLSDAAEWPDVTHSSLVAQLVCLHCRLSKGQAEEAGAAALQDSVMHLHALCWYLSSTFKSCDVLYRNFCTIPSSDLAPALPQHIPLPTQSAFQGTS